VRLDWISEAMRMGERSSYYRTIRRTRAMMQQRKDWIEAKKEIREISTSHRAIYLTQPAQDVVVWSA